MKPFRYFSLCSGIEAATAAWRRLGWIAVGFAEIESFPSALLARLYPHVPNHGDMREIDGASLRGRIDALVAGTPCQSFSIAGLRRGLQDQRGNLTLEFVRIADESDPAFIVWENVPGVLSDRGNAFGCFLGALAGEDTPLLPPGNRWADAGYVLGPKRSIAWRILDAQYFGLAQRRRRVFLVACPGDGADPREILFESEGLRRDTPPGRSQEEDLAGTFKSRANSGGWGHDVEMAASGYMRVAGTLTSRFGRNGGAANGDVTGNRIITQALTGRLGSGGPDDNKAQGGFYLAGTLSALSFSGGAVAAETGYEVIGCRASGTATRASGPIDVAPAINAHGGGSRRLDFESEAFVAHTLRGEGFDASEDGTGKANLVVAPPLTGNRYADNESREGLLAVTPINTQVATRHKALGERTAFGVGSPGDPAYTIQAEHHHAVSISLRGRDGGATMEIGGEVSPALRSAQGGGDKAHCLTRTTVRRLTPRECERLQGFPDDYTLIPYKRPFADLPQRIIERSYNRYLQRMKKRGTAPASLEELIKCADGPRYKALGNSMAVPVMMWIGQRIDAVRLHGCVEIDSMAGAYEDEH